MNLLNRKVFVYYNYSIELEDFRIVLENEKEEEKKVNKNI